MFNIANTIAYESSMPHATEPGIDLSLPASCWWDVGGHVGDRQYVPTQGEALVHLLLDSLAKMNHPDLFVISPFREIITQIQHLLLAEKELKKLF